MYIIFTKVLVFILSPSYITWFSVKKLSSKQFTVRILVQQVKN